MSRDQPHKEGRIIRCMEESGKITRIERAHEESHAIQADIPEERKKSDNDRICALVSTKTRTTRRDWNEDSSRFTISDAA